MSSRTYPIGLPVMVTVHDDGTLEVEVDMSETSDGMQEVWDEREFAPDLQDVTEERMLLDQAIVDANPNRSTATSVKIPAAIAEMRCPAGYNCAFRTFSREDMEYHLLDAEEMHGKH